MDNIKLIVQLIGMITIVAFSIYLAMFIKEAISNLIRELKWKHKYKHRFDKPPIAKCYCKDCRYWEDVHSYSRCTRGHIDIYRNIEDTYFCWLEEPRKEDPEGKRNER